MPQDAVNLNIETIEMADSSQNLACAAVYVRFKRKSGEFSCQLIFSRSTAIHCAMHRNLSVVLHTSYKFDLVF